MLYGVGEWSPKMIKMTARLKELQARKAAADQQAQAGRDQAIFLSGVIDNHNYMITTWMQDEPPEVMSHVPQALAELQGQDVKVVADGLALDLPTFGHARIKSPPGDA
jgi:hypothetical protein